MLSVKWLRHWPAAALAGARTAGLPRRRGGMRPHISSPDDPTLAEVLPDKADVNVEIELKKLR